MIASALRFGIIQVVAYLLDYGVFWVIFTIGMLPALGANIVGKVAGNLLAFFLHRSFTFQNRNAVGLGGDATRYIVLVLFNMVAASALMSSFLEWSRPAMAKLFSDALGFVFNYFAARLLVFRNASKTPHERG